ncbi:odorant receptor 13a-like isoform X3, partial [Vespula squamosa]
TDLFSLIVEVFDDLKKKTISFETSRKRTLGIDSLANRILFFQRYTLSSQYCELRSLLSPRFYTTLFNRKIVTNILKAITWSKRLLVRDSLFLPYLFYGFVYLNLGFLDLTDFITDFHYVLTNVVENMLMFMKLTKFGVFRVKWQPLAKFFAETENDHIIDNYKTKQDRMIFTNCKKITSKFFVITFSWMTLVLLSHYFKAVIPNILMLYSKIQNTIQLNNCLALTQA